MWRGVVKAPQAQQGVAGNGGGGGSTCSRAVGCTEVGWMYGSRRRRGGGPAAQGHTAFLCEGYGSWGRMHGRTDDMRTCETVRM